MKKIKFIPVLAMAALLSACELGGPSVKAPKFAKEGDKVEAAAFIEDALKAIKELEVYKAEPSYKDRFVKVNNSNSEEEFLKRGNKKVNQYSYKKSSDMTFEFDFDSYVAYGTMEEKVSSTDKSTSSSSNRTANMKTSTYLQKVTHEGKNYFASVSKDSKKMMGYAEITELTPEKALFESIYASGEKQYLTLTTAVSFMESEYPSFTDEEKAKYNFYKNGDVYTITYEDTREGEYKYDDVIYYTTSNTSKMKLQYEIKGKDVYFRSSEEEIEIIDYKKTYYSYPESYFEGDHYEEKEVSYSECSAKDKSVSLSAIDTTGFSFSTL